MECRGRSFERSAITAALAATLSVELIGLKDARSVDLLTVTWPASQTTQTFRDITADQSIEITEGSDSLKIFSPATTESARPNPLNATVRRDGRLGLTVE